MKHVLPTWAVLALALTACTDRVTDAPADTAATSATNGMSVDQPAGYVPPATAPAPAVGSDAASTAHHAAGSRARFDGYGDLRFGMTAEQVEQAWDGELNGEPMPGDNCYYLSPVGNPSIAYFALMIADGTFVRYDVGNDRDIAPGGGQRGMTSAQIEQLYPGRIEQQPHKYVQGGQYLRIEDDDSDAVLIFETGADGNVTDWHLGLPPQVGYIEGCA